MAFEAMSRKIAVQFMEPVDIHRARNFAEAVDRELRRTGIGTAVNPDTMTSVFWVQAAASRHVGEVKRIIKSCAGQENLLEHVTISQES
jgi:hypothetical protein